MSRPPVGTLIPIGGYKVGDILNSNQFEVIPSSIPWTKSVYARDLAIDSNKNIYVYDINDDGHITKYTDEGIEVWQIIGWREVHGSSRIDIDSNDNLYVVITYGDYYLYKLSSVNGNEIWRTQYEFPNQVRDVKVGKDDYIYVATSSNRLYKYDADGNEIWEAILGGHQALYTATADSNGYVYAGHWDGSLYKLDADGNQIWKKFGGGTGSTAIKAISIDSNNNVYFSKDSSNLCKMSSEGIELWTYTGHTRGINTIIIDDLTMKIYSGSDDKTIRKLNNDGVELQVIEEEGTIFSLVFDGEYLYGAIGGVNGFKKYSFQKIKIIA